MDLQLVMILMCLVQLMSQGCHMGLHVTQAVMCLLGSLLGLALLLSSLIYLPAMQGLYYKMTAEVK